MPHICVSYIMIRYQPNTNTRAKEKHFSNSRGKKVRREIEMETYDRHKRAKKKRLRIETMHRICE